MKPHIDRTEFGMIEIAGEKYEHDVLIRLGERVKKRKKALSKEVYGTSHVISLAEAEHIYEDRVEKLIIGSGQTGMVKLSKEAAEFFKSHGCQVTLLPTPQAIEAWNQAAGAVVGLFHVTC
jgi:hypothetical protein